MSPHFCVWVLNIEISAFSVCVIVLSYSVWHAPFHGSVGWANLVETRSEPAHFIHILIVPAD